MAEAADHRSDLRTIDGPHLRNFIPTKVHYLDSQKETTKVWRLKYYASSAVATQPQVYTSTMGVGQPYHDFL